MNRKGLLDPSLRWGDGDWGDWSNRTPVETHQRRHNEHPPARKMKQKAPAVAAPQPPRNEFANNEQFRAMKQAIKTALN